MFFLVPDYIKPTVQTVGNLLIPLNLSVWRGLEQGLLTHGYLHARSLLKVTFDTHTGALSALSKVAYMRVVQRRPWSCVNALARSLARTHACPYLAKARLRKCDRAA